MSTSTDQPHLLVYEPAHGDLAVGNLLQFQQPKPRIDAFIRSVGAAVQCLEDQAFAIIVASLIGDTTPLDLLRRWGSIVGESQGALARGELLTIVCNRITANVIGTTENKNNLASYLAFLVSVFDGASVAVEMHPIGSRAIRVSVTSDRSAPLDDRAGAVVRDATPLGTLVVVEATPSLGLYFDGPTGLDGPIMGRTLFGGFRGERP